ncbi:hypothetical protein [Sphingobium limneticum]|uniref:hypothetical protein n=1 Tax=Sphingobium limneticum TaxID=1007511 RepID=UPI0014784C34|nr:hypothetical protein [Sphingobium limneticum]
MATFSRIQQRLSALRIEGLALMDIHPDGWMTLLYDPILTKSVLAERVPFRR